jgi:hypothetical protein
VIDYSYIIYDGKNHVNEKLDYFKRYFHGEIHIDDGWTHRTSGIKSERRIDLLEGI